MNKEIENKIINNYVNNKITIEKIKKLYHLAHETIVKVLENHGIKRRKNIRDFIIEDYFENIDTELKAYFVGFLLADGCISDKFNNKIGAKWQKQCNLNLQNKDSYILEKLKSELQSNKKIVFHKNRPTCKISFTSDKLCNDLMSLGVTPRKSLTADFDITKIPEKLQHHFIRGLFDGDGCVYFHLKNNKLRVKRFDFCGSEKVCLMVKTTLESIIDDKDADKKVKKFGKIYRLSYGRNKSLLNFYNYLYKDASFYLLRKKEKFELIFKLSATCL